MVNTDKLKERLKRLKEKSGGLAHLWKTPASGKAVIRLVPYPHTEDHSPFLEYHYHYGILNRPIVCPKKTHGEECPLCDMVDELWKGDKEDQKLAKQYMAKMRIHIPVLVRGEEDQGVRFYSCGTQVYEKLLEHMIDPDYGDITDIKEGHDVTLTLTPASGENRFPSTSVVLKPKKTPLAASKAEAERVVASTPNFGDLVTTDTYKEIEEIRDKLISGEVDDMKTSDKKDAIKEDDDAGTVWDSEDDDL